MPLPEMIIFDYGQTLINEKPFDSVKGTKAVLEQCACQPVQVTAETVQKLADEMTGEIGHYVGTTHSDILFEVHNHKFQNYLYEFFGIKMKESPNIVEQVFWDNASEFQPTDGILDILSFLEEKNIRTGIISNISFSGDTLARRVRQWFPQTRFEFIIASSEYVFRKPHQKIFEIALRKADLDANKVWYCGDNPVCDVEGSAAAGLTPIWYKGALRHDYAEPQCEHMQINQWPDLISMLADVLSGKNSPEHSNCYIKGKNQP